VRFMIPLAPGGGADITVRAGGAGAHSPVEADRGASSEGTSPTRSGQVGACSHGVGDPNRLSHPRVDAS
jgi:hypothetical protein